METHYPIQFENVSEATIVVRIAGEGITVLPGMVRTFDSKWEYILAKYPQLVPYHEIPSSNSSDLEQTQQTETKEQEAPLKALPKKDDSKRSPSPRIRIQEEIPARKKKVSKKAPAKAKAKAPKNNP